MGRGEGKCTYTDTTVRAVGVFAADVENLRRLRVFFSFFSQSNLYSIRDGDESRARGARKEEWERASGSETEGTSSKFYIRRYKVAAPRRNSICTKSTVLVRDDLGRGFRVQFPAKNRIRPRCRRTSSIFTYELAQKTFYVIVLSKCFFLSLCIFFSRHCPPLPLKNQSF